MLASSAGQFRRKKLRKPCHVAPPLVVERRVDTDGPCSAHAAEGLQVSGKLVSSARIDTEDACASHQSPELHPGDLLGIPQGKPSCTSTAGCDSILPPAVQQEGAFRAGPARARLQQSRACASAKVGSQMLALSEVALRRSVAAMMPLNLRLSPLPERQTSMNTSSTVLSFLPAVPFQFWCAKLCAARRLVR